MAEACLPSPVERAVCSGALASLRAHCISARESTTMMRISVEGGGPVDCVGYSLILPVWGGSSDV